MNVNPIRVFDIPSSSRPGKKYRVQFDGARWFCDCPAWIFNLAHKGEKDAQGRSTPRECKHTLHAQAIMGQYQNSVARGVQVKQAPFREIQPLGPWFDELQDYVGRLMDFSRNGAISNEAFVGFRRDMDRFREEADRVRESLETADTFLEVYGSLLSKIAGNL